MIKFPLKKGCDVNARGGQFGPLMGTAIFYDHKAAVELLVDRSADRDTFGFINGDSARRTEIMRALLERGAEVGEKGKPCLVLRCR